MGNVQVLWILWYYFNPWSFVMNRLPEETCLFCYIVREVWYFLPMELHWFERNSVAMYPRTVWESSDYLRKVTDSRGTRTQPEAQVLRAAAEQPKPGWDTQKTLSSFKRSLSAQSWLPAQTFSHLIFQKRFAQQNDGVISASLAARGNKHWGRGLYWTLLSGFLKEREVKGALHSAAVCGGDRAAWNGGGGHLPCLWGCNRYPSFESCLWCQ